MDRATRLHARITSYGRLFRNFEKSEPNGPLDSSQSNESSDPQNVVRRRHRLGSYKHIRN
jgi:hypothetical protein